jgi:hypothetical protein
VRVTATPELREYVERTGGAVYVTVRRPRCCGGVDWVDASITPPESTDAYDLTVADGVLVCTNFAGERGPSELHLRLDGRRKKRPVALWDGCAFVV